MTAIKATLEDLRNEINALDTQLVTLLVKRMHVALSIADLKENSVDAVTAKNRVEAVLGRVSQLAANNNGDEAFIRKIYELIISELTEMQLKKKGLF
ncbi:hypothetical protein BIY29_12350 [Brenneria alni]|uniref:chorismate mutase n=1 Tax=Brenneria alni TaxID=71656 RepID=A0A421DME1_9GAMM|nr:chorismate mutase [Brenneria alni]RLM22281.1 hypothetical protein BIY29_12350 [Brenneria alni]